MFNKDFYPTPEHVIDSLGIDCSNKVVLEPSAGKGNIVEWLYKNGAKEVLTCESNTDLAEIIKTKSKFLQHDFLKLTAEQISHIQLIIMNPPFSNGDKHILKAWEIAPAGCEIISLCNAETFNNDYTSRRKELLSIIDNYGIKNELGNVFFESERTTNVNVGLVKLYKPSSGSNEFEGFFLDEEIEEKQGNGIMRFDAIKDVVQRYIEAVKLFDKHTVISEQMNDITKPFGIGGFSIEVGYDKKVIDRETFKKELQKKAWNYLFNLMNMNKYLTSGVMKDINKFVEQQSNVPFTMKNIYLMFDIIVGTREQVFDRALEEAVDKFTMHTDENRYNVEGWKTNSGYMLNRKFIINYMFENHSYYNGLHVRSSSNVERLDDLIKVLHSLTATTNESKYGVYYDLNHLSIQPNTWYDYSFFEFKAFKKGTMHLKFKDEKVWEVLNRRYAKIKGQVLPEKFNNTK